ncbi:MAG: hypothetical protein HHJ17_13745 [Rhodoferax sp.]|uniref:hypothetical protein n=1 Tax=Rhodoferax sp. TaxID=50421 RepID=UPI001819A7ED|nr:hypothetical protein [Rhodoferax sp.]NMM14579.1 hypothetical protein [Rhodoferax sp.]
MLRDDMQRLLSEQQFATASFTAAQVNQELDDRFNLLGKVAKIVGPAILGNTTSLQAMLENRPALQEFFNGGYIAYRLDGTALAAAAARVRGLGEAGLTLEEYQAAANARSYSGFFLLLRPRWRCDDKTAGGGDWFGPLGPGVCRGADRRQ